MADTSLKQRFFKGSVARYIKFDIINYGILWFFALKLSISQYSVQMRENTDQRNSKYVHFSHSVSCQNVDDVL